MTNKRDLIIAVLATFCLTVTLFLAIPTRSQSPSGTYDSLVDLNHDGQINILDAIILAGHFGTAGDPTINVNVTNWPSQLLSNYVYDSGFFTLGPYGNNSQTYRDLSIAGYRQVSVYVGFDTNLYVSMEIRVGMGNFSGEGIAGFNWATYYNISRVTGQGIFPFSQTIDVRGPQLRIEVYNDEGYSIDVMHIVVYATC
jgi:hypothetical protein